MTLPQIHHRYELNTLLGQKIGRRTWLATDRETDRSVVIKLLLFGMDFEWDSLKLFEREAKTLQDLDHPAIPKYLDWFEAEFGDTKGLALVQTYISAQSLETIVQSGRTFSTKEVQDIAQQILKILDYLHNRNPVVIHRDIKPSNILLSDRTGNSAGKVSLVDFGSVQNLAIAKSCTMTIVGTYGYMPPEQFSGRATPASDLYSLGATLIYLLTGQHPADLMNEDLELDFSQMSGVKPDFTSWLHKVLNSTPSKRFQTAIEASEILRNPQPYNLTRPINKPFGTTINIKYREDHLSVQLPGLCFYYMTRLNTLITLSATTVMFICLILSFSTSIYYLIPFIAIIYIFSLIDKFIQLNLIVGREKIIFQPEFMKIKLPKREQNLNDLHQICHGQKQLSRLDELITSKDLYYYQLILKFGTIDYIIQTQNEIEITWLVLHGLSCPTNTRRLKSRLHKPSPPSRTKIFS